METIAYTRAAILSRAADRITDLDGGGDAK